MDALEQLGQMHVEARQAFDQIMSANPDERGGLWAKLRPTLLLHEQIEDNFVYDPAVEEMGSSDPTLADWEDRHDAEAEQANGMMAQLGEGDPAGLDWLPLFEDFSQTMVAHMEWEETELWPLIRRDWGEDNVQAAGAKVAAAIAAAKAGAGVTEAIGKATEAIKSATR